MNKLLDAILNPAVTFAMGYVVGVVVCKVVL